jgi:CheY-like chemotaxis protein
MIESKSILLVEDDPHDLELTLAAVRSIANDQPLSVASSGEDALDYLYRRGKFDARTGTQPALILLDVKLPLLDGLQVLDAIKSDQTLQPIPVVMLTSSRETRDVDESYRLGANAYVVKSLDFPAYLQSVKQICEFWIGLNQPPGMCTA